MPRILGLDIGDRRIGIALSDESHLIATPHSVYERVGFGPDTRYFVSLVKDLQVGYIVAGLPYNMDGSLGEQACKVQALGEQFQKAGLDIRYIDERLTTKSAERALIEGGMRRDDRRGTVDKVAAALILQGYLDQERRTPHAPGAKKEEDMDEHKKDLPETEIIEEEYDMESDIVELTDEDGVTTAFEYQATIEMDGAEYVVLMELENDDEDEDEGAVVIMKIEQDEKGEDYYVSLDDEETQQKVFDLFLEYLDEEEEGEEEEDEE